MTTGMTIFGLVVFISGAAYFLGRFISRKKLLGGRDRLKLEDICNDLPEQVDKNQGIEILRVLGKVFGLQPELLRLSDSMSMLYEIDSWMLGMGQEKLERWLVVNGIPEFKSQPSTVNDFIISVLSVRATELKHN